MDKNINNLKGTCSWQVASTSEAMNEVAMPLP
jgi:hypothetical protein